MHIIGVVRRDSTFRRTCILQYGMRCLHRTCMTESPHCSPLAMAHVESAAQRGEVIKEANEY